ncbi:hypothetical protein Tco_0987514 [Tanacetum coccineum]
MDALALTPCYSAFLTTADVLKVYMHQLWDFIHKYDTSYRFRMDKKKKLDLNLEIFRDIFQICLRVHGQNFNELPTDEDIVSFFKGLVHTVEIKILSGKTTGLDKLHLSRSQILWDMYYKNNVDYVELLCEDFTYQIDNRGVKPSKKARNFKKPTSPKLTYVLVSPKEPTRKSKRVKRPAKKSTNALTECVVIRDTPMMSLSKKKEKVTVKKRKGIELLYEVALTKEAQYEEVRKKSLRDFHKTHPSSSSIVTKIAPSATKIKPSIINEGTSAKLGVLDVTKEESSKSEVESWGRDEHDSNNDHDSSSEGIDQESDIGDGNTQSDNEKGSDSKHETDENETGSESGQEENEEEVEDKAESDKDKGMDYTTNQFDDDVDVRLNEPVNNDEGFIQKEGTDDDMINIQHGNKNLEITLNQVIKDAHVTISTIPKKTKVLVTSSSHSSDLAAKFLNFADIPTIDAEIVSSMDVHVHHELPSNQTPTLHTIPILVITNSSPVYSIVIPQSLPSFTPPPPQSTPTPPPITEATKPLSILLNFASVFQFNNRVSALEREVTELKKDDLLNTQVTALVDEHLDSRLGATRDEFMSYLPESITARITEQVKIQIPHILPNEVSNFAPSVIKSKVIESLEHVVIAKESTQPQSIYKAATLLIEFELKKILIYKMDESQSYLTATEHKECYDVLIKSYDLDKSLLSIYDKVYLLKRSRKDKDKDEDPFARSD